MPRPEDSGRTEAAGTPLDSAGARILSAASLAASSHNIQPWVVRVLEPRRWILAVDPVRRLPAVDPENREPILSLGAFLENLDLAAGSEGLAVESRYLTEEPFAREMVEIRLVEATPTGYPMSRITSRRTLRKGFRDDPISREHLARLLEPYRGSARFFAHDSEEGRYLRENTLAAFRQQSWRDDAQAELALWIHFDSAEAGRARDGLTPATMEITGLAGWVVRTFYNREKVMTDAFRERGIQGVAEQVDHAGGWIVTSAESMKVPALLEAGRQLQGMLLLCREMGLAAHPMTQMIQESPWKDQIGPALGISGSPQIILRVGYVNEYPEPVSLRRPPEDFVLP